MTTTHGIDRSGAAGGSGTTAMTGSLNDLADPGADRIVFWDDSVGQLRWLTADTATGIDISGSNLILTAVPVANGGTGASNAATARTNLGLGTADSPQFTGIELGHATDTTLTRVSAGDVQVEGNRVFRVGGADVPLADGGTGASLVDPGADAVVAWDDSGGAVVMATIGTGLSLSASNVLSATATGTTLGTPAATTSGTSVDFTGFASGVKRVAISFAGMSTSSTDIPVILLGDAGGFEPAGYSNVSHTITNGASPTGTATSSGFLLAGVWASTVIYSGTLTLTLENASNNTWAISGTGCDTGNGTNQIIAGTKSLSAVLTQIRLTTRAGVDTFDAGEINIQYE